jgi:hypothetical protein
MKSRTFIIGLVSLFSSLSLVHAQGMPVIQNSFESVAGKTGVPVLLARVNLYKPSVVKSVRYGEHYTASFVLETLDPSQNNIRYRISLVDTNNNPVYTYVFPNAVSLTKGIPLTISERFPVPVDISGVYTGIISIVNREGLPLATGEVSNITLASQTSSQFTITSCITDENVYDKRETVSVTCAIKGEPSLGSKLLYSVYRNNRAQSYMKEAVSLEKKKVTFTFPAPGKADAYSLTIQGLNGGALVGETLSLPFAVRGTISNILSIATDKQAYAKGDVAKVNVGLNVFSENAEGMYALALLKSADRTYTCGPLVRTRLSRPTSVSFTIPIVKECEGFTLSITITNEQGVILDEEFLSVEKLQSTRFIGFLNFFLIIASMYILLSAFIHRSHRTKKS